MTEIQLLTEIINKEFNTNLLSKSRRRKVVDARILFSKILRDRGYIFQDIAKALNKDHSTIIYYLESADVIIEQIASLKRTYDKCVEMLNEQYIPDKAVRLTKVAELTKKNYSLTKELSLTKKYGNIIDVLNKIPQEYYGIAEIEIIKLAKKYGEQRARASQSE